MLTFYVVYMLTLLCRMSTYLSCMLTQFILHVWVRRMLLVFQNWKIFYEFCEEDFCIQNKTIFTKHSLNQQYHYVFVS